MSAAKQTSILFTLPLEIRQEIYSHVYRQPLDVYNEGVHPTLILNNNTHLLDDTRIGKDAAPTRTLALLRTCRTLYHEAFPCLYAQHDFHVTLHVGERDPRDRHTYVNAGPLDCTNKFLRSIQRLDISLILNHEWHVDVVLRRLRLLAAALGEGGVALQTWKVEAYATRTYVTPEFVATRITEMLKQLDGEEKESRGGDGLFRRVLAEVQIKSWSRYLHLQCTACDEDVEEDSCKTKASGIR